MAVVKANCYSNGIHIALLIEDYVCGFAVANVFEGIRLRKLGITKQILSLSFSREQSYLCIKYDIMASLSCPLNYVEGVKYHIAIDSGMNRGGVKGKNELWELLKIMAVHDIYGVYSHIYSANEILTNSQIDRYEQAVRIVEKFNSQIVTHIFATNYKFFADKFATDFVRLGIGMYENAVAVTSNIMQIKNLRAGESVGYDGEFIADKSMKIALCDGGYYDGVIRRFKGENIAFNTDFCKVIGKISMDTHIIDVSDTNAKVGSITIIYDTDKLSFANRAEAMKISEYELMTSLKGRFEYVYLN